MDSRFSSSFTVEQFRQWCITQEDKPALELNNEVLYLFRENKWKSLGEIHRLYQMKILDFSEVLVDHLADWGFIGSAFKNAVETIIMPQRLSELSPDEIPNLQKAFQLMGVKKIQINILFDDRTLLSAMERYKKICQRIKLDIIIHKPDHVCEFFASLDLLDFQLLDKKKEDLEQGYTIQSRSSSHIKIRSADELIKWGNTLSDKPFFCLSEYDLAFFQEEEWRILVNIYNNTGISNLKMICPFKDGNEKFQWIETCVNHLIVFKNIRALFLEGMDLGLYHSHFIASVNDALSSAKNGLLDLRSNHLNAFSDLHWIQFNQLCEMGSLAVLNIKDNFLDTLPLDKWVYFCNAIGKSNLKMIDIANANCHDLSPPRRLLLATILKMIAERNARRDSALQAGTVFLPHVLPINYESALSALKQNQSENTGLSFQANGGS